VALRLAHLNLPARDPKALARWYGERFGLDVDGAFASGPGTLLVFEHGEPLALPGNAHFGFEAEDRAEVVRLAERFGCDPELEDDYAGFKARDPEGNGFEVYWEARAGEPPRIRALGPGDHAWLAEAALPVGGLQVVSRGALHTLTELPGFVAERRGGRAGFACYRAEGGACELVALRALAEGRGVGAALLAAVEEAARAAGAGRLWLVTTNDRTRALRFYQRRGFRLTALRPAAIDRARALKPGIPLAGDDGIALRDELELEKELGGRGRAGGLSAPGAPSG
jgi:GNAT superfamily N-acetyltransferase